jgi:hypothetical protein
VAVGETLTVELVVSVVEGVGAGVPLLEPVGDPVQLGVAVCVGVTLQDSDVLAV